MKVLSRGVINTSLKDSDKLFHYLIAFTIPFSVNVGNIAIIAASVYTLFTLRKRRAFKVKAVVSVFSLPLIYFTIILVSTLFSYNVFQGLRLVDKSLFFVLIPFIFFSLQTNLDVQKVLKVFSYATVISSLSLMIYAGYSFLDTKDIDIIFFHNYTRLFDLHPVYFSALQAMGVFILTDSIVREKYFPWSDFVMIGILILGIFLSASKIVIVGFIVLYLFQLSTILQNGIKRFLVIAAIVLTLVSMLLIPKIKTRFLEGLEFDMYFQPSVEVSQSPVFDSFDKEMISDLEIRYLFAKIGLFHFNEDGKWLFGYGVGDLQDYLDLYYMQYGLAPSWFEGYNLHNQYLQVLLSTGIFSLFFFLYYLISMLGSAIRKRNSMQLRFMIIVILIFLFESVLMRNKGVVFFVYFSSLFMIENLRNENSNYRN